MKLLNLGCGTRTHPDWTNVDFKAQVEGVIAHDLLTGLPFADESFDAVYHSHLLEHLPKTKAPLFLRECSRVLRRGGIIRVAVPDLEQVCRLYLSLLEEADRGDEKAREQYEWILLEMFDQMVRNRSGGEMLEYWKRSVVEAEDFVIQRVGSEYLKARAGLLLQASRATDTGHSAASSTEADPCKLGEFRLGGEIHQWMYDRYSLAMLLKGAGFVRSRKCAADESSIPAFNSYLLDIEPDGSVRKPDSLFMEGVKP